VANKNKFRKPHDKKPRSPAKWAAGTHVRVKSGTTDPDYPDIPLGGWAGTIQEVDQRLSSPMYLIVWNKHTLNQMHPVYRNRCERDGLELESMWLDEKDIEPDTDLAAMIELPTNFSTRPLNEKDQEDRIRAILGLTSDNPLSEVDEETLHTYHAFLLGRLSFPFTVTISVETGRLKNSTHQVMVVGLLDADDCDEMYGLLCDARQGQDRLELPLEELELKSGDPNRRLIEDYSYWFGNWG
jgi:Calcium binding